MELQINLPNDFLDQDIPKCNIKVSELYIKKDFKSLNNIPISVDTEGNIVSRFGDTIWDCSTFRSDIGGTRNQSEFNFSFLTEHPTLLIQAKLIAYGWLYAIGNKSGKACKITTLTSRFNIPLKKVILSLIAQEKFDITELNNDEVWSKLEEHLEGLSRNYIIQIFSSLKSIVRLNYFLPFKITLPEINFSTRAKKLSCTTKRDTKQYLAIPQDIVDKIYSEAVLLVESAWKYRKEISQLEQSLQSNYEAGRTVVDDLIATGKWKWLHDEYGNLDRRNYGHEVNNFLPEPYRDIIHRNLSKTGLLPGCNEDGNWYAAWRGQLQAACFICCAAFTGMRVSELFELRRNSFHSYQLDGQDFHVVKASTHKMAAGKKAEEWLCSPIVSKAIDLASALSEGLRNQLYDKAINSSNNSVRKQLSETAECLWLTQKERMNAPKIIARDSWNERLRRFSRNAKAVITADSINECIQLNPNNNGTIVERIILGEIWPLSTHQFRRTFAVFSVRNNLGHPIAIKQQFKHLYLRMSDWYSSGAVQARLHDIHADHDLIKILNEVSLVQTTAQFDKWFNGDEKLSGSFGKMIVAMRDRKPEIYSSWDNLYRLVKAGRMTLHGTLHSYCKNGYDCDMEGISNPSFCVDCKSSGSVIDGEKAQWWKKRHVALTTYLVKQNDVSPGEYSHCITQIRAAENVMRDFDIPFEEYEHPIEVVNL
ncbi:TPA: hypothetical protein ACGG77_003366 [Vibrio cholerae]